MLQSVDGSFEFTAKTTDKGLSSSLGGWSVKGELIFTINKLACYEMLHRNSEFRKTVMSILVPQKARN
jgi:hypothetical protein